MSFSNNTSCKHITDSLVGCNYAASSNGNSCAIIIPDNNNHTHKANKKNQTKCSSQKVNTSSSSSFKNFCDTRISNNKIQIITEHPSSSTSTSKSESTSTSKSTSKSQTTSTHQKHIKAQQMLSNAMSYDKSSRSHHTEKLSKSKKKTSVDQNDMNTDKDSTTIKKISRSSSQVIIAQPDEYDDTSKKSSTLSHRLHRSISTTSIKPSCRDPNVDITPTRPQINATITSTSHKYTDSSPIRPQMINASPSPMRPQISTASPSHKYADVSPMRPQISTPSPSHVYVEMSPMRPQISTASPSHKYTDTSPIRPQISTTSPSHVYVETSPMRPQISTTSPSHKYTDTSPIRPQISTTSPSHIYTDTSPIRAYTDASSVKSQIIAMSGVSKNNSYTSGNDYSRINPHVTYFAGNFSYSRDDSTNGSCSELDDVSLDSISSTNTALNNNPWVLPHDKSASVVLTPMLDAYGKLKTTPTDDQQHTHQRIDYYQAYKKQEQKQEQLKQQQLKQEQLKQEQQKSKQHGINKKMNKKSNIKSNKKSNKKTSKVEDDDPLLNASIVMDFTKPSDRSYDFVSRKMGAICDRIKKTHQTLGLKNKLESFEYDVKGKVTKKDFHRYLDIYENNQTYYLEQINGDGINDDIIVELNNMEHWFIQIIEPSPKRKMEKLEWKERELSKLKVGYSPYCNSILQKYIKPVSDDTIQYVSDTLSTIFKE